jgi:hypothetical protein
LAPEGRITVRPGAVLTTRLWLIVVAQRAPDLLLEAVRALLREVWRQEQPAAA